MGDQVIKKQYYEGTTLRQEVDYKYNIRGWLTKINDPDNFASAGDYFSVQLFYDQKVSSDIDSEPRYNGNISFIKWQSLAPLGSTNPQLTGMKGYEFRYDKLNRLGFADYFSQIQGKFDRTSTNREWITGYDKNGNITALDRHGNSQSEGMPMIDKLTYHYKGNQVIGIDDAILYDNGGDFLDNGQYYYISHCVEYEYDASGNLTKDLNKGIISITYNELNLPETIDFGGNSRIQYDYDALGTKRRQTTIEAGKKVKTIEFIGNFVYENDYPAYNTFDEGRIVYKPDSTCFVETYLKDHLGNVRVAYANDGVKDGIRQVNAYYPFGMNISALSANSSSILQHNEYLYNGKMFQDELGLNWLDYGARFYDPVVGRWHSPDMMSEKYYNCSPYNYVRNNPILRLDIEGKWDVTVHVYNDRKQHGYGIAIVTDRNGNEVYRFNVRAEGSAGHDRFVKNSDTPLGTYDIPDNNPWITGGSRSAYGPNARLNMTPESGEIAGTNRDAIRIHGGRQEKYNPKSKEWEVVSNPQLKKTHGCLRAYDSDMATFKQITDNMQAKDENETPGKVNIMDDLEQHVSPTIEIRYDVPAEEKNVWQKYINDYLKIIENKKQN